MFKKGCMIWCVGVLAFIGACGDNVQVKNASGNAILIADSTTPKAVAAQDITIDRVRIWKSISNDQGPGVAIVVDDYTVEIWAKLSGEEKTRYHRASGFLADPDGNLYLPGYEPGQVVYLNSGEAEIKDSPLSYTITTIDPLISVETTAGALWDKRTVTGTVRATTSEYIDPATISESPWANLKRRIYQPPIFSRWRYEKNTDFKIKAKLGCQVKEATSANSEEGRTYVWGDVELGNTIVHGANKDYDDSNASAQGGDKSGDDNYLRLDWSEMWYLTGINVTQRTLRVVRERTVPFYMARELPNVDRSTADPAVSGIETLVRSCNSATKSSGSFRMIHLSGAAPSTTASLSIAGANNYCATLSSALEAGPDVVRSIALTDTNFLGNYSADGATITSLGCNFPALGLTPGTWLGGLTVTQYHTGNITVGASTYSHFEQSDIAEVSF